jgi:hypothetical protein
MLRLRRAQMLAAFSNDKKDLLLRAIDVLPNASDQRDYYSIRARGHCVFYNPITFVTFMFVMVCPF